MKAIPRMKVTLEIMSSKLAFPLKVVRTVDPPDIASPFPVTKTSNVNRTATSIARTNRKVWIMATILDGDYTVWISNSPRTKLITKYAAAEPAIT